MFTGNRTLIAKLAGFIFQININIVDDEFYFHRAYSNLFDYIYNFLVVDRKQKPDFIVNLLDKKKTDFIKEGNAFYRKIIEPTKKENEINIYCIDNYDIHLVFKYVIGILLDKHHSFILHTSAVLANNKAYLFLGRSGSGKSTIAKLLAKKYQVLCDDMAFVRREGDKYYFYQTPFLENNFAKVFPKKLEVKKIFILNKAKNSTVEKINLLQKDIVNIFIGQILNRPQKKDILRFINHFKRSFYLCSFSKKDSRINDLIP